MGLLPEGAHVTGSMEEQVTSHSELVKGRHSSLGLRASALVGTDRTSCVSVPAGTGDTPLPRPPAGGGRSWRQEDRGDACGPTQTSSDHRPPIRASARDPSWRERPNNTERCDQKGHSQIDKPQPVALGA